MANEFNITPEEIEDGKTMGGIAYFGLLGFLIAFLTKKENKYVLYHAQQSLAILIVGIAGGMLNVIPFLGQILFVLISLGLFVLFIMGLMKGFSGEIVPLPIIGEYAFKLGLLKPEAGDVPQAPEAPGSPDVE